MPDPDTTLYSRSACRHCQRFRMDVKDVEVNGVPCKAAAYRCTHGAGYGYLDHMPRNPDDCIWFKRKEKEHD